MTRILLSPALVAGMLLFVAPAHAEGTLEEALADLAKDVKLKLGNASELSIRPFTSTGHLPASSGAALVENLARHLAQVGLTVKPRAPFLLVGEYREVEDLASQLQAVEVSLELRKGDERTTVKKRFVKNQVTLSILLGLSIHHQANAGPKEQKEEVKRAIDKPTTHFTGTTIRSANGSPFAIEILTRGADGKYTPQTPRDDSNLAFVPLPRTTSYAVRLINDADFEVAVSLHLDGRSMFHFSDKDPKTGKPSFTHLLVPPKSSVPVEGWHIQGNQWDHFLVVGFGEKIKGLPDKPEKSTANLGTITANFHAAWKKGQTPPPGEPRDNAQGATPDKTGRGERYYQDINPQEREIGRQRAAVSVRYSK